MERERVENNLQAGNLIIALMGPGEFTSNGHFIVLTGLQNGRLKINDPNSRKNSEKPGISIRCWNRRKRYGCIINEIEDIPVIASEYTVKTASSEVFVRDYIEERAVETAIYMIETKATVRQTAKKFGVSKSTVHKDLTSRLVQVNPGLAAEARKILDVNKSERHIRGGMATREKYLHQKQK